MKTFDFKEILLSVLKLCALGTVIGVLGGLTGACFVRSVAFVTGVRAENSWLVFLLPLGGVIIAALYKAFGLNGEGGTNEIIHSTSNGSPIRFVTAPLIFASTVITHFAGGSAGREGAALQMGGAIASKVSDILKMEGKERTVVTMSGMSAVFAGVFGMPLTATAFVLEFSFAPEVILSAALPCFISAITAGEIASFLGATEETVCLTGTQVFSLRTVAGMVVLSIGLSLLGRVVCFSFHKSEIWTRKLIPNSFLRSVLGALAVIAMTAFVGDMRYSGSGMEMALGAVRGEAHWFDFILKILFTSVTLAAGFKGGEIVPMFCVGATFGGVFGGLLGLDSGFCAAIGLIGLFCCCANAPVSAVLLGIEMFGFQYAPYYILVCAILVPLSVRKGLFADRRFNPMFLCKKQKN